MIRLLVEIAVMISLAFLAGGSIGWVIAALLRPIFDREDDEWRDAEVGLAVPLPAPLALPPPRALAAPRSPSSTRPPPHIEAEAIPVPTPRRAPRPNMFRPPALPGPRNGRPDALQRLPGIDGVLASRLYGMGVYHFGQIAAWTPQELAWVSVNLDIGDLPMREDWVGHAARLAIGDRPTRPRRV